MSTDMLARDAIGASAARSMPAGVAGPALIAVYPTHTEADAAVRALARAGFDLHRVSIIGNEYHTLERPAGFYNAGDRMRLWGSRGAFWGGLFGLMASPALMLLPVVGHLVVLGPLASALVGTLEGAAVGGGASVLGAALASAGVPLDSVVRYEAEIKADRFLVVVHDAPGSGPDDAAARRAHTEQLLRETGALSVERY